MIKKNIDVLKLKKQKNRYFVNAENRDPTIGLRVIKLQIKRQKIIVKKEEEVSEEVSQPNIRKKTMNSRKTKNIVTE